VGLFRRREPLHEQLAREGGLVEAPARDPRPASQETEAAAQPVDREAFGSAGIHGLSRPREWDVTLSADAGIAEGSRVTFVALPDGSLLVEDGDVPDATPLADRVETELSAPYRARAVRAGVWMIQAKRIEVVEIRGAPKGDAIELSADDVLVDGERVFGSVPELENRGDVVRAERLDGDLWEVQAGSL
jgi:hypothetical protein